MAFLTMFMAVLAFFRQDDLYRLLGYLTIAHLGYIFVGLALGIYGSHEGYQGAVLYLLCDGAAKATLLMSIGSIAYATGTRKINQLQGLSGKLWLEGIAYLIGALAATGVPPFAGFWPKFMIFTGTLNPNVPGGPVLLALLAAESVVSFGWFLWLGQKIFLGKPSEIAAAAGDPPPGMAFALIAGMALCLLLPLVGIPLVSGLMP
jgi:hydrogenase-4 component D